MSTKAIKILEVIETMPPCYKIALVQHDDSLVRINESLSKSKVLLLCQLHNVSMPNHPDFLLPFSNKIVRVAVTGRQGQCEDDEPMDRPDTLYNVNLIFQDKRTAEAYGLSVEKIVTLCKENDCEIPWPVQDAMKLM